jgi:ATP-binding cassette subfamily B multidrug efflux pump
MAFLVSIDYLQILVPKFIGKTVNLLTISPINAHLIFVYAMSILAIAGGVMAGRFAWRLLIIGGARKFEMFAHQQLFDKFLRLPISFFERKGVGDLMAYFSNDIMAVRASLSQGIVMTTDSVAMTIFVFFGMLTSVSYKLVLLSLIPLPFVALASWFFGGRIHSRFKKVQKSFSNISERAQESFTNVKTIKSYGVEENFEKIFSNECNGFVQNNVSLLKISAIFDPLIDFLAAVTSAIALFYGGRMVINGSVSLGDFVAFIAYLGMLVWPFIALGYVVNVLQRGRASFERLNDLMKEKEKENGTKSFAGSFEKLKIKDLSFSYDGERKVLDDVNLEIKRGQKVALVGRTGCGKSTLAKVLVKLYQVEKGHIFYNDLDIVDLDEKSLREKILLVPQDAFLFSSTISKNIAFGFEKFSYEDVEDASKVAHFHEEVVKFDRSYDTMVGERGVTLSGGQRQRLTLSRGIFKGAEVIILDDVLSAVDSETASNILTDLSTNLKNSTMVVITHNLASIKNSDVIFVMDEGHIVEHGRHEELMRKKGLYYELFMIQKLEREIGA